LRAGAVLLDWLIASIATIIFYAIGIGLLGSSSTIAAGLIVVFGTYVLGPIAGFAFYAWQLCRAGEQNGQTIGKHAVGIRIVRADGRAVNFTTVLLRGVLIGVFYVLTLGVGMIIDYLWPLWDERSQTLHDKLANTYVVLAQANAPAAPVRAHVPAAALPPTDPPRPQPALDRADKPPPIAFDEPAPAETFTHSALPVGDVPAPALAPVALTAPATLDRSAATCRLCGARVADSSAPFCPACSATAPTNAARHPSDADDAPQLGGEQTTQLARPTPPLPEVRPSGVRRALLIAVSIVLVLASIATAAIVLSGPHKTTTPPVAGADATISPSAAAVNRPFDNSTVPRRAPDPGSPAAAAPDPGTARSAADTNLRPTAPKPAGPASVLRRHLQQLNNHAYAQAFALMSPTYRNRNPQWPALRADAAPTIRIADVGTALISNDGSDVQIKFYAHDTRPTRGSDTNCRRFSGHAHLQRIDGQWRYDPAANSLSAVVLPSTNTQCP
jgi:uncharacterized RDD family membrane protein YckC